MKSSQISQLDVRKFATKTLFHSFIAFYHSCFTKYNKFATL